jgi:hypothetical protein
VKRECVAGKSVSCRITSNVLLKMSRTINNPNWANFAVIAVLIFSIMLAVIGGQYLPSTLVDGRSWLGYMFVAASLLGLAFFLPETQKRTFSSRQSAIGGCCLFLYFAILKVSQDLISGSASSDSEVSFEGKAMLAAFMISFVFYWMALWAIRGLRTPRV